MIIVYTSVMVLVVAFTFGCGVLLVVEVVRVVTLAVLVVCHILKLKYKNPGSTLAVE